MNKEEFSRKWGSEWGGTDHPLGRLFLSDLDALLASDRETAAKHIEHAASFETDDRFKAAFLALANEIKRGAWTR